MTQIGKELSNGKEDSLLDFGFYNMDCMDGMKQFPDKYFDLAIVDPPYGGGASQNVHVERERERERIAWRCRRL